MPGAILHFVETAPGLLPHKEGCVVDLNDQKRFQHSRYVLCRYNSDAFFILGMELHKYRIMDITRGCDCAR